MWIALRTNVREVLEAVSIADLVSGELPSESARSPAARSGRGPARCRRLG